MLEHDARSRIALALDVPDLGTATRLIEKTQDYVGVYKVGLELFIAAGPDAVARVLDAGSKCFLDLKLHDIPATMGRATASAREMGAHFLTVHASAGSEALVQAEANRGDMKLLAVTVLTSFDQASLEAIGFTSGTDGTTARLARVAWDAGVRGFVSSAHESEDLRTKFGVDAFIVTPGIRPANSAVGDQKRVMTPTSAIAAGSDLLVIGRPIRDADDPMRAAASISHEVHVALSS